MKLDALEHPKTLAFASALGVELPTAIGHLELLWAFTAKQAPRGNVGKWADGAIALACHFKSDPGLFVNSLLKSGLIDAHKTHRLVIHDWREHCPNWVRAKLKKLHTDFISPEEASSDATEEGACDPPSEPSSRAQILPSQAKPCLATTSAPSAPAQDVSRETAGVETDDWFLNFKLAYPVRAGDYRWHGARKAATARLAEGHTPDQFIEGARRYAAFCESTGKLNTEHVKQAATFLGPDKPFMESWALPETPSARAQQKRADSEQRELLQLKTRAKAIGFREFDPAIDDLGGYRTLVEREESQRPRRNGGPKPIGKLLGGRTQ